MRRKVYGMPDRPRMAVYRTSRHIYVQLIDDSNGRTLAYASSQDRELKGKIRHGGNVEAAGMVGDLIARRALGASITDVVFDRGGFKYHGCIKALADKAREAGLKF